MHSAEQAAGLLEDLLDAQRAAVLAGRFDGLTDAALQIDAILPRIRGLTDAALARRLQQKSARNAACLEASARGVRAAQRRFAEILAARTGFSTYGGDGRRSSVSSSAPGQLAQRF